MEKKYIIYVGGFILPDGNAAAHRVLANAKIFRDLGYEIIFLGTQNAIVSQPGELIENPNSVDGFTYYNSAYPRSLKSWIHYLTSIHDIKTILQHVGYSNVYSIVAYNYQAIAQKRLMQLCKEKNIFFITDCTEWQLVNRENPIVSILKNLDTFYRMKILNKRIDGMIAISTYLFDYYRIHLKNMLLLPPLVDLKDKKWSFNSRKTDNKRRLIYAGSPGKGEKDRLDKIVNALAKLKSKFKLEFSLTIVGSSQTDYTSCYGEEILPDSILNYIVFKGRMPHIEAIREIQKSDFSIFLRDSNLISRAGFPTKFVESVSCGVPVLTNSTSNIKDYLEKESFGFLIDTSSENATIDSLYKAITLPNEELDKMKANCISSQIFDYSSYLIEMKSFLNSLEFKN